MNRYRVLHTTTYRYETPVTSSFGQLCLLPRDFPGQRCTSSEVVITPEVSDHRERIDYFGNRVAYFTLQRPHQELTISASSDIEVDDNRGWEGGSDVGGTRRDIESQKGGGDIEAANFIVNSPRVTVDDRVRSYALPSFDTGRPILEAIADLSSRIHRDFSFDATTTTVNSTIDDLFDHGAGVCQDFAHLGVACLRSQGIPARYVSGYLETIPPPGMQKLVGADVSHAWISALVPGLGWVDVDPTNNTRVKEDHVTLAWGRDYGDVPPLTGVFIGGGQHRMAVSVDVMPLD